MFLKLFFKKAKYLNWKNILAATDSLIDVLFKNNSSFAFVKQMQNVKTKESVNMRSLPFCLNDHLKLDLIVEYCHFYYYISEEKKFSFHDQHLFNLRSDKLDYLFLTIEITSWISL